MIARQVTATPILASFDIKGNGHIKASNFSIPSHAQENKVLTSPTSVQKGKAESAARAISPNWATEVPARPHTVSCCMVMSNHAGDHGCGSRQRYLMSV